MAGKSVGTFPWHLSLSFFLSAVAVRAQRKGRRPGPEQSTGEPRGGRPHPPRPKSTPGCGSPGRGEAGKVKSTGAARVGSQFLPCQATGRLTIQDPARPAGRPGGWGWGRRGAEPPGRVCGNMDGPTALHGASQCVSWADRQPDIHSGIKPVCGDW